MANKRVDIIASIGAQDRTGNAFRQVDRNIKQMQAGADRTSRAVNSSFRMMRGGASQFGYQIQDIAVQLQSGQNAMLVFGQQGSQIASLMGPGGAVAGAFIAVGAALGTAFLPKLFGTEKALADVDAQLSKVRQTMKLTADGTGVLTTEFEELAKVSKDLARASLLQAYNNALLAVDQSQKDLITSGEAITDVLNGTVGAMFRAQTATERAADKFGIAMSQAGEMRRAFEQINNGNVDAGMDRLRATLEGLIDPASGATVEFRAHAAAVLDNIAQYDKAVGSVDQLKAALETLAAGGELATDTTVTNTKAVQDQVAALEQQVATLGMTERALALYEARQKNATPEEIARIKTAYDQIDAWKAQQKAMQDQEAWHTRVANSAEDYAARQLESYEKTRQGAIDLLEREKASQLEGVDAINHAYDQRLQAIRTAMEKIGAEKARFAEIERGLEAQRAAEIQAHNQQTLQSEMSLFNARLAMVGQFANAMAHAMQEGSKAQKAAFLVSKGVAAAEAIVNAELAAVKALAELPPPSNVIYSNIIRGMGYASAATIVGTTLGSFEGGGFTGRGARVGGLDGKGGFPAILHPNESVIDHEKGGGMGMNVNFTIVANDTRDFDRLLMSRRGQIISMINQASNNKGRRGPV